MAYVRTQLQEECSRAMRNYLRVVQEGCELLGEVKEGLIPKNTRDKIFSHRKQELLAHAAYTRARTRLWSFLSDEVYENHTSYLEFAGIVFVALMGLYADRSHDP